MERRPASRGRLPRVILASIIGLAALGAMPWSVAADETPTPSPEATVEPTATPEPTPEPTPAPTPDPTPAPLPAPAAAPDPPQGDDPEPTETPSPTRRPRLRRPRRPRPTRSPASTSTARPRWSASSRTTGVCRRPSSRWPTWSGARATARTRDRPTSIASPDRTTATATRPVATIRRAGPGRCATSRGRNYQARAYSDKSAAINSIADSIGTDEAPGRRDRQGRHARLGRARLQADVRPGRAERRRPCWACTSVARSARARTDGPTSTSPSPSSARYFTRYHEWQRSVPWEGKWVVIAQ